MGTEDITMPSIVQSKPSPHFTPVDLSGLYNRRIGELTENEISVELIRQKDLLLTGTNVLWGIPFELRKSISLSLVSLP